MTAVVKPVREQVLADSRARYIEANGLRHRVLTFGDGDAPDLMYIPGITSPAETVHFIAEALPDFTVHVADLRGRGGSDRAGAGGYTLADYRDDFAELVAALGLTSPVVVGHSLGARIAAAWATSPARVKSRVVLVDPPLSGPGRPPYPMSAESFARQLEEARAGTTPEEIRGYFPAWPERELRLRAEVLADCDDTAVRESHEGFEKEDFFEIWERLPGDVALIYGANSPVVPPSGVEDLRARNSRIPLRAVPGAGHMIPWDNLPGFIEALHDAVATPAPATEIER